MMFFFSLCNLFFLFLIVVFVKILVVFWKDVVDKKELFFRDVLVIFNSIGWLIVKWLWFLSIFLFLCLNLLIDIFVFGKMLVLFLIIIMIWCNIWWIIILMCLLEILIFWVW